MLFLMSAPASWYVCLLPYVHDDLQTPSRMPASTSAAASELPKEISTTAPVRPTFPAYSAPSSDSEASVSTTPVTSAPTPVRKIEFAASSTSKLIHPDDDISLVM